MNLIIDFLFNLIGIFIHIFAYTKEKIFEVFCVIILLVIIVMAYKNFLLRPSYFVNARILFSQKEVGITNYSEDYNEVKCGNDVYVKVIPSVILEDKNKENKYCTVIIRIENIDETDIVEYLGNEKFKLKEKIKKGYIQYKFKIMSKIDGTDQGEFLFRINSQTEKDITVETFFKGNVNKDVFSNIISYSLN